MAQQVEILHRTRYVFDRPVVASPHLLRLRPVASPGSVVLDHSMRIDPADHAVHWQQDPFGNHVARVSFLAPLRSIDIEVKVLAEMAPRDPFDFFLDPAAQFSPFSYGHELAGDLAPHLEVADPGPLLAGFLAAFDRTPRATVDLVVTVARSVASAVRHEVRMEMGVLDPDVTLQRGVGSCRDSAWLLIQLLRHLGLAARFVSGYLVDLTPTGDVTDLHAWAEVYLPGAGWIGLDPTSGLLAAEGHIPLAASPHPRGAAAVEGTTEPCEVALEHTNSVRRLDGADRVVATR
jgi:transglutaminase-like putative cysteine protease